MTRLGLIARIALLVVAIELAAFSALGWFYVDRFTTAAEERLRSRLHLVGQMIAREELPVSAVALPPLVSDLVGAPCLAGVVVGGSGRVIVATDPAILGRPAATLAGPAARCVRPEAPDEEIIAARGSLTGISHIHGPSTGTPIYCTAITVSTTALDAQKDSIAWWGRLVAAVFILLSSAALILVAQRMITRRVKSSLKVLKRVEDGALAARIPVSSDDELGQLQHGINSMTAKLGSLLEQHRRNEEELGTILDGIGDGVIAIGADGTVLRCNPSANAIIGASPATGHIADLLPDLPWPREQGWWRAQKSLTASGRVLVERPGPDGGTRAIELGHGPICDPDGTVIGAVMVLQDVTARRRAEAELRQAVERLTVSNAELERFAYVASHDLQEPLRNIVSFTQLLDRRLGESLAAEDRESFGFVVGAAKRMSLLINDLLAYSHVNTRGSQFATVSLQEACAAALDNLRDVMAECGADVTVGPLPEIAGDSIQLMQLFHNLIGNAVKFRRDGVPPRVAVTARRSGNEWIISVADNGIGIATTDQDIFEIFRRLHTAGAFPGSGVGLAICKRIVQRHGGRIWFDALDGQGTTFHFALPVAAATARTDASAPSDPAAPARPSPG